MRKTYGKLNNQNIERPHIKRTVDIIYSKANKPKYLEPLNRTIKV